MPMIRRKAMTRLDEPPTIMEMIDFELSFRPPMPWSWPSVEACREAWTRHRDFMLDRWQTVNFDFVPFAIREFETRSNERPETAARRLGITITMPQAQPCTPAKSGVTAAQREAPAKTGADAGPGNGDND